MQNCNFSEPCFRLKDGTARFRPAEMEAELRLIENYGTAFEGVAVRFALFYCLLQKVVARSSTVLGHPTPYPGDWSANVITGGRRAPWRRNPPVLHRDASAGI